MLQTGKGTRPGLEVMKWVEDEKCQDSALLLPLADGLVAPAGCGTRSIRRERLEELLEDTIYYSAGNTVNASGI